MDAPFISYRIYSPELKQYVKDLINEGFYYHKGTDDSRGSEGIYLDVVGTYLEILPDDDVIIFGGVADQISFAELKIYNSGPYSPNSGNYTNKAKREDIKTLLDSEEIYDVLKIFFKLGPQFGKDRDKYEMLKRLVEEAALSDNVSCDLFWGDGGSDLGDGGTIKRSDVGLSVPYSGKRGKNKSFDKSEKAKAETRVARTDEEIYDYWKFYRDHKLIR